MNFKILTKLSGGLLIILSLILLVPGIFGVASEERAGQNFFLLSGIGVALGTLLFLPLRNYKVDLNHRTGMAIVGIAWLTAALLGAFPYYLSEVSPTFIDSFFESISGFSGTGASVLSNLEELPQSILLWRSMTQWLGGMGIIVFFIAILPILGVGGVQLFKAEITGPSKDKITPRVRETAKKLWGLYFGLTVFLTLLLALSGMNVFDALNHAMTTLSTGGFSTRSSGIAAFDSALIEYLIIFSMFLSSINFSLHFLLLSTRKPSSYLSTEALWYFSFLTLATLSIVFILSNGSSDFSTTFRDTLFTVVCTASSTGFTGVDYIAWPIAAQFIIVLLMIMGGMSGSTAGGIKCIRIVAAIKQLFKELKRVVHPRGAYTIKVNNHSIPENVVNAIWGFIFLYLAVFTVITFILTFDDLDLLSAATATISALSNIGPALGSLGPYDNYAALTDLSKVSLMAGMLLGRLEFYTLIVIFTFEYWRK